MYPITRKEYYLAKAAGTYTGPTPPPVLREDYYLATLAGDYSGNCPAPVTRLEKYMSAAAGITSYVPQPITRIEMYWYAIAKGAGYVPEPVTREEKFLYAILKNPPKPEYLDKTAEGSMILLDDSASAPLTSLTLYGWSKQDGTPSPDNPVPIVSAGSVMTTGAQLLDYKKIQQESNHCTVEFTENGVQLDGKWYAALNSISVTPDTDYCISYVGSGTKRVAICARGDRLNPIITANPSNQLIFNTGENNNIDILFYASTNETPGTATYTNIMLNSGSTALPWEPYTGGVPGVNPYEGEINVTVQGGNLLDADQYYEEYKQSDGTYAISVSEMGAIHIPITEDMLGKQYTFSASGIPAPNDSFYVQYYENANKVFNGNIIREGVSTFSQSEITFIPEEIGGYIRLSHSYTNDETAQVKDIMLNSGSTALPYEPYKQPQTLTVSTPGGLPGIPVTVSRLPEGMEPTYVDESGQAWVCDEVDFEKGVYVRRVGNAEVTIDSTVAFTSGKIGGVFIPVPKKINDSIGVLSTVAKYDMTANIFGTFYENPVNIVFVGEENSTLEQLKKIYDGSIIYYILATPTESPLSAETIAAYKALHTYSPATTVSNDAEAWMQVGYKATP